MDRLTRNISAPLPDCCKSVLDNPDVADSHGVWGIVLAVLAALGASACCWLPLLAIGLGIGSAGLAVVLWPWRPVFGAVVLLSLGFSFYRFYRRPRRRRQRLILWIGTVIAATVFFIPELVAAL